jgi:hypothetical protein
MTGATEPASLGKTSTAAVQNNDERETDTTPIIPYLRRHKHIIRSKRAVKFEAKRTEWCNYKNFSKMSKVLLDKEGLIVEDPKYAFEIPAQYLMQR